ncbi:hypothetical protein EON83_17245 [bacterium]|nr:MAG: hypothetical protein EON83_17245 [bacterium]
MLIPPLGRDPVDIENERLQKETVQKALDARTTRTGGISGPFVGGTPSQGEGLEIDGVSLKGKLGFALGLSGFGGDDYLFPPDRESEVPERFFTELK